jgi:hypothetical protein
MVQLGHGAVLAFDGFAGVVMLEDNRADVAGLDPFTAAALACQRAAFGFLQRAQCGVAGGLDQPGIGGHQRLDAYRLGWREGQVKTRAFGRVRPRRTDAQHGAGVGIDAAQQRLELFRGDGAGEAQRLSPSPNRLADGRGTGRGVILCRRRVVCLVVAPGVLDGEIVANADHRLTPGLREGRAPSFVRRSHRRLARWWPGPAV